ncbi:hypothetical protein K1T71_009584 [Dendrolimus kikuchii]|uniref:Uncharacterized protein n=1 Tax=Dendrolimus kikuchii TaxID=765133 RepID=A0ACC1CSA6_9NEOP|nr:hypothetical protein K1T71_009584 [Dendrolimus kikuchii]
MSVNNNKYSNFVKPSSSESENTETRDTITISGNEARELYLEEIQDIPDHTKQTKVQLNQQKRSRKATRELHLSDKELFLTVQNNDVNTLIEVLDNFPDKIRTVDSYGWSLLMIACQANSIETAKELLIRGVDQSIRDKAGNSAQSLVIKSRNFELIHLLLDHRTHRHNENPDLQSKGTVKKREEFTCEVCDNKVFSDKIEHLSSTIHNINMSKGKIIPANYVIPSSNRGYQIMLKAGWNKECGLGPDGSGKRYPLKSVQKKDRKGLGSDKRKVEEQKEATFKHKHRSILNKEYHENKLMEINFRRQFY